MSSRSSRSRSSRTSGASSTQNSVMARAKLEAAKARMVVVEREVELKNQQAFLREDMAFNIAKSERQDKQIDIQLLLLEEKKLIAEAMAETEVYEKELFGNVDYKDADKLTAEDRTKQYVLQHSTNQIKHKQTIEPEIEHTEVNIGTELGNEPKIEHKEFNIEAELGNQPKNESKELNLGAEFGRFLVKKDLLMTRFSKFHDDPVTYKSWKTSFQTVTRDLGVTPEEEIDLLLKWLGPNSAKQVNSIRTANSSRYETGLYQIWERLDERYGSPEIIESILRKKVLNMPKINAKDYTKLYDLYDIISEINSLKDDETYSLILSHYDSSIGVNQLVYKLPVHLQHKWAEKARRFKVSNRVAYPPFGLFVGFIKEMCALLNDPSFQFDYPASSSMNPKEESTTRPNRYNPGTISAKKTELENKNKYSCKLHPGTSTHTLDFCREFRKMSIDDKRQYLKDNKICYRCCKSDKHLIKDCRENIKCEECDSNKHITALHIFKDMKSNEKVKNQDNEKPESSSKFGSCCTQMCGEPSLSKSCAKIVKVNIYHKNNPEKKVKMYALIDDQSNRSLAHPEVFNSFKDICEFPETLYTLHTCGGSSTSAGRRGEGFVVEGIDGTRHDLPCLTECNEIPNNKDEIPTPDIVYQYPHLKEIASNIPPFDEECDIQLLIGRDLQVVHHVQDQIIGPLGPYAQQLSLGWVVVGETCIGNIHTPHTSINVKKTYVHSDGRQSVFPTCDNQFKINENNYPINETDLFVTSRDDNKIGTSVEDRVFVEIMDKEFMKDDNGCWVAPLPFRTPRKHLPNNREMAMKRASYLDANLQRNNSKREHFVQFMGKVFESGAAEVAPPPTNEVWYLPLFGVYHPKKPDKIRGVFDSSAMYRSKSLNSVLLSGPNLVNSLLSILLRFRTNTYAIIADIEQMFYSFLVKHDHRDLLRFFWYRNNDPKQDLIEYRMCAHVFGNSPSPAVATYGLRKTAENAENDVKEFVNRDFYVDDGLTSLPEADKAVSLLQRTQECLKTANIRLHKIASNSKDVMSAFQEEDLNSKIKSLNFEEDLLPTNQTLGLSWDLNTDSFNFDINLENKPYTRRGLLSTLNSVFDPLGFVTPIIIRGKMLMREITTGLDWDEPLNTEQASKWSSWKESLLLLKEVSIPRMYLGESLSTAKDPVLHIFSDASEKAVSAVAYVELHEKDNISNVGFVMGKSKLAPVHGHTIPRLELCAALLAAEISEVIQQALDVSFKSVKYYTDSRVVLGYINNTTRRFYNYVSNRVQKILCLSKADQWNYVNTKINPADIGSRGCSSIDQLNRWLNSEETFNKVHDDDTNEYPLITPDDDKEIRQEVTVNKICVEDSLSKKFSLFSRWHKLLSAIIVLKRAIKNHKMRKAVDGHAKSTDSIQQYREESKQFILKTDQKQSFGDEIECLAAGKPVSRKSSICSLNPYLDSDGILRVGGRIGKSCLPIEQTNPIILARKSHIASLIAYQIHEKCNHQGRLITEGSIRNNGYWIVGAKRLVSSIIHQCVTCRKLRGKTEHQIMADLPSDRLTPCPPFTRIGVDVFGPWEVVSRKTRGGMAHSKRWAVLFTCLTTRAVHIEVIEEMSSSSFINALRRFTALRGDVTEIRSDRGTNFVGATEDLKVNVINVEDGPVPNYLRDSGVTWTFNAPHSSHMGGVWERMIGIARNILDIMLLSITARTITHEVLVTLMAEVCAIMNSRPITAISSDSDDPVVLTPAILLNQRTSGSLDSCDLDIRDIYKKQWKLVQMLANLFWKKWRDCYLQSLQTRRKWKTPQPSIKNGDVVLLKEKNLARNDWTVGLIIKTIESKSDNRVRKAEVRVCKQGKCTTYTRPITEMVLLVD